MSQRPTLLKALLVDRHWQKYETFCQEYRRAAADVDKALINTAPSKAQFYRWLSGDLKGGSPYPDACRVLEHMFPEWTATQLLAPCPPERESLKTRRVPTHHLPETRHADVVGIFATRAEFASKLPTAELLSDATDVRAAGLSLNLICQHYPDHELRRLINSGTSMRCLFLDPDGEAIRTREREEGHRPGTLTTLTELNIRMLTERVRPRLSSAARERLQIAVYDETVRFNIVLIDNQLGVVQPYLPEARGIDSPTLLLEHQDDEVGLFPVFAQVFESLWERSKPL